jgi:RecA/RadA recombinase
MATKKTAIPKTKTAPKAAKTKKTTATASKAKRAPRNITIPATLSREDKLRALEALLNRPGERPVIRRASESESSYLLRRPTGITSLDISLAGGFPASAPVLIAGPDGAGKDYLLLRTCAETQRLYGDDFAMAIYLSEFKFDKPFARDMCGLKVAMTPEELDELDSARRNGGLPALTDEDRARYSEQLGHIYIIEGVPAEYGFDAIIDCVESNAFQIVAINSVGFMQTLAKENTESYEEFPQQRNEAILLSKFMPDLALTLNKGGANGERNESLVVLIDQVRAKDGPPKKMQGRPPQEREKYRPARQIWALKHGIAITLELHKSAKIYDEVEKVYLGRTVSWEISKGKLGTHDGLRGDFNFFYDGGADSVGDLVAVCERFEVFERNHTWYTFEDPAGGFSIRTQGKAPMRRAIMEDPRLCARLRYLCFQKAKVVYRHR